MKFLQAISKINDACILDIASDKITALINSQDNTLILTGEYISEQAYCTTLNIPSLNKLIRVLDAIETDDVELNINSNNLEYRGKRVKFKYHLHEDGILSRPIWKIEKIKSFQFDIDVNIAAETIQQLIKGTAFATETNKLYFYTKDGVLISELADKARHNTDCYSLDLFPADFTLANTPINVENIRLLQLISNMSRLRINSKIGVLSFEFETANIKLQYIITSLQQ